MHIRVTSARACQVYGLGEFEPGVPRTFDMDAIELEQFKMHHGDSLMRANFPDDFEVVVVMDTDNPVNSEEPTGNGAESKGGVE